MRECEQLVRGEKAQRSRKGRSSKRSDRTVKNLCRKRRKFILVDGSVLCPPSPRDTCFTSALIPTRVLFKSPKNYIPILHFIFSQGIVPQPLVISSSFDSNGGDGASVFRPIHHVFKTTSGCPSNPLNLHKSLNYIP